MDGTSSGGADVTHRGESAHGDDIGKVCEHEFTETTSSSKCGSEIVVESTRATKLTNCERLTGAPLWNHRLVDNSEYERLEWI